MMMIAAVFSFLAVGLINPTLPFALQGAPRHGAVVANAGKTLVRGRQARGASGQAPRLTSKLRPKKGEKHVNEKELVCAACGVACSSEVSFADHIYGSAHVKRAGYAGFAGLIPNAAGLIPELTDPQLRAEASAFERGEPIPPAPPRSRMKSNQVHPSELVCLVCGTSCSSEASFLDHLHGSTHKKNAGRHGYAGLAPNALGLIPELVSPKLRADKEAFDKGLPLPLQAQTADGSFATVDPEAGPDVRHEGAPAELGPWLPPIREISVTEEAEQSARLSIDELRRKKEALSARREAAMSGRDADGGMRDDGAGRGRPRSSALRVRRAPQRNMPRTPAVVEGGGPEADTRASLPVAGYRDEILRVLASDVSIVEGETGSGKTTQVPQFLLEAAAESGEPVNIICTQPRRISAIGVADRVAAERGERVGEGAVGYAVRGESRQSAGSTSLLFCTTGVLLRMLEEDSGLANVTHVLVDEVHERSVENDFLLLTLRMLLLRRREEGARPGQPKLKVCLMSATLDGDVLSSYCAHPSPCDLSLQSSPSLPLPPAMPPPAPCAARLTHRDARCGRPPFAQSPPPASASSESASPGVSSQWTRYTSRRPSRSPITTSIATPTGASTRRQRASDVRWRRRWRPAPTTGMGLAVSAASTVSRR